MAPTANSRVHTFELTGLTSNPQRRFRVTALHGERVGSTTELTAIGRGGDTVTLVGGDVVHQYRSVGSAAFTLRDARTVQYLFVGGGASGTRGQCNAYFGHGGGGGGVSAGSLPLQAGTFTAVVGAGGAGRAQSCLGERHYGNPGGTSSLSSSVGLLGSATGGSPAVHSQQAVGGTSGSGGIDGAPSGAHRGGNGAGTYGAGGGGGAGGPGVGTDGGPGVTSDITGERVEYGRGGAGRNSGGFGTPGVANSDQGPGAGGSDGDGGVFLGGNAGTLILRYPLIP